MTAEAIDAHAEEAWLAEHTFYCVPLKAQITPAQCKANREKPTIKEGGKKIGNPFLSTQQHDFQPLACEGCLNWKHFCKEETKEESMGRRSGICQGCQKEDLIFGRGLCKRCYQKLYQSKEGFVRFPRIRQSPSIPGDVIVDKVVEKLATPDADQGADYEITVNFKTALSLLKIVKLRAREEFRDPANQILWFLKCSCGEGQGGPHAPAGPA